MSHLYAFIAKEYAMKSSVRPIGQFVPRVAKLDKNKYVAYVDLHVGHLWDMALQASPVRICKKRKRAEKMALVLAAMARKRAASGPKGARRSA